MIELLPVGMVLALMVLLFAGYPVAFVLIGVTAIFAAIAMLTDQMAPAMLAAFSYRLYGLFSENLIFPAVPPLILMGVALARSGLANDLFHALGYLLRGVPGGPLLAVLVLGILLAPSAGLLGAAVGVLALAALPTLLQQRYDPALASGTVAAAGTLGVILPPAIMLFFLADQIGTLLVAAFAAVLMPAALLVLGYVAYIVLRSSHRPKAMTIGVETSAAAPDRIIAKLMLPTALVVGVLLSIIYGWATPPQSGSLGALGAVLLMVGNRSFSWSKLREILLETGYITAMVFLIIIAANAFSFVFRVLEGDEIVATFLASLGLGSWGKLLFILGVIFALGFFIDWLEIVLITLPIFAGAIATLDFSAHVGDPQLVRIWIGAAIAIVLQTSFLTPPFGFALFFLRGAAPPSVRMEDIYRGVAPIVAIQLAVLAALLAVPWLATHLPQVVLR